MNFKDMCVCPLRLNNLNQVPLMEAYYTPVKDISMGVMRVSKTQNQAREGDWVCYNCNNLNFSFRKKCNRCKIQTREQNQSAALILSYYEKNYAMHMEGNGCGSHTTSAGSHVIGTPIRSEKENKTPEKERRDLPSVSPLVKKYNAREMTPLSEGRSQGSVWGVSVRDFQEVLASSNRSQDPDQSVQDSISNDDLQRMIGNIIL